MICENCNKEHDGSYGSGRFCCKECARSFSTKNENKLKLKEAKCIECGKKIYVNKRASLNTCKCIECSKKTIKCTLCGNTYKRGNGGCKNEFCKTHNVFQINTLIKYFGFDKSKLGTPKVEEEFYRVRNYLYDLYWNKNFSSTDLAKMFNYESESTNITQKFFKYLNIPTKSVKYATIENVFEGRLIYGEVHNQYKQHWHTTWNGKDVYLRLSYEEDYANELDKQKIDYDVECLRIKYFNTEKNEYRCAIPDFYIPSKNMIVEIKSDWTFNEQEMQDKKKAYLEQGYNFKLILEHKETEI